MPKAYALLVKNKTGQGHAGSGLAVLVPVDAAAAADPACDAAEAYKGPDGQPLLKRTVSRHVMENDLRRAEKLHYDGKKDGIDGVEEAKKIHLRLAGSFKSSARPDVVSGSSVHGDIPWSSDDARVAGTNLHKAVALKALVECKENDLEASEYLRIASTTPHADVAFDAVGMAVKAKATKDQLVSACEVIKHEQAAELAFDSAKDGRRFKE